MNRRDEPAAEAREMPVRPTARHRLYRATASEHFVLNSGDERIPVGA
jgi:hypothetical protein